MFNWTNRSNSLPQLLIKVLLRSRHNLPHIHRTINIQTHLPHCNFCLDRGAIICLAGSQHLEKLRVSPDELTPCFKRVMAVAGFQLICHGWLPVQFKIGTYSTKQPLYICNKVNHIYFSRKGCMDTNIIPKSFPFPINTMDRSASIASAVSMENQQNPSLRSPPRRPNHLPFPATTENIPKLEKFIWDQFASSTFNKSTPFPSMSTLQHIST